MNKRTTFLALTLLFTVALFSQSTIFSTGESWNYYDAGNAPADDAQGDTWIESDFDDSSWSSGNAQLGYGDGDEATVISASTITGYFRKTFTATAGHVALASLDLNLLYDDGAVIYLNDVEVHRENMPGGAIVYGTFSSADSGDNATATANIANTLVVGSNTIAVEIHQRTAGSSDMSFDLELLGIAISTSFITDTATWKYLDDGTDQGTGWTGTGFNDAAWASGAAELGYGDADETTVVSFGPDTNNKYPTTYFRHSFNVPDHTLYSDLALEAIRDDGMVVYLNGIEIWSDNMPGTWNYLTYAANTIGGVQETTWINQTVANSLITGTNVIAVEIHQREATSSDISFNFRLTGNGDVPAEILRGPYHQKVASDKITIKYRTNTATESIINYGISLGSLGSTESDLTPKIDHEVELTGLTPNTVYYYEIADNDGVYVTEDSEMYMKTAPTIGTQQFVRAWILGDPGTEGNGTFPGDQKSVRDAYYAYVNETGPTGSITNPNQTDLTLFLGDNAYNDGTDLEYQAGFFDVYDDMLKKTSTWSTLGNHDGHSASSSSQSGPYYDIFTFPTSAESGGTASGTEAYYSFDYANIHFIVLESYTLDNDAAQMAWCTTDIQNTTQDWIVTFFHHPPYTKGSHDSDTESNLINMRNNFLPILEANGVDLVLSGHSHSYERSFFVNGHYGLSGTFSSATNTVGLNGDLSGKADTGDGAYQKTDTDVDGAVYITAGSSGKATGAQFAGQDPYTGANTLPVMYYSAQDLGSTILEVEDDGIGGQNLNIKFLRETGVIDDYFTINKSGLTLSTGSNEIENGQVKIYPVPANSILNIEISANEILETVQIYNAIGQMVKQGTTSKINVNTLEAGTYIVQIRTDKGEYFKNILVK